MSTYSLRIKDEDFHAGNVIEHPVEVIAHCAHQHHVVCMGVNRGSVRPLMMKTLPNCLHVPKPSFLPALSSASDDSRESSRCLRCV